MICKNCQRLLYKINLRWQDMYESTICPVALLAGLLNVDHQPIPDQQREQDFDQQFLKSVGIQEW